jgi:hypothetical protein
MLGVYLLQLFVPSIPIVDMGVFSGLVPENISLFSHRQYTK